ncbi:MAG: carbohydrate-binding family 9-like protein [Proteobacteria bacterium]|nr:carbohydrate-binding family 9-like protein [Pseudomonadota bacterium]
MRETMARSAGVWIAAALVATLTACIEKSSYVTPDESDKVAKMILGKAPEKIEHRLDVELEGKIALLGYDLEPESVAPGGTLTVTWYWQCKEAPGPGYRLFTHVVDGDGVSRVNRDGVGAIRKHYQPEHWKAGVVVRDTQKISIPKSWDSKVADLRVGVWGRNGRLKVTVGAADSENRIKAVRVPIEEAIAVPPVTIPRAPQPPAIDGAFEDEASWSGAVRLDAFADTLTGEKAPRRTDVRLMWDDAALYVAVKAEDDFLQSKYEKNDDELWHEDAFEIFLDPRGDKKDYYEIQVSPAGLVFDSYLPRYRKNDNAWSCGAKVAAKLDGTLNDGEGGDKGWTAELAIPWKSLEKGGGVPPGSAEGLKINLFRVDVVGDKTEYSAWSPPLRGDFHALDRFRAVALAKAPKPARAADAGVAR